MEGIRRSLLIYVHKEKALDDVERLYPAERYVMLDDKLRILDAVKKQWKDRVMTVFPEQGHYARDAKTLAAYRPANISIASSAICSTINGQPL